MSHLLLLHGALGTPSYFNFIKDALQDTYTIHAPAFEGHAMEPLTKSPLRLSHYVDQITHYMDTHQLTSVDVFGYSMGGYVALALAQQFPQRIGKVMTLATKYAWSPEVAAKESSFLKPDTIEQKVPHFAKQLQQTHGEKQWASLVKEVAGMLMDLGEHPLLHKDYMLNIQAKVQVMVGDKDAMVSIDETRQLAVDLPQAYLAVLPNTIHPFEKINQSLLISHLNTFFQHP